MSVVKQAATLLRSTYQQQFTVLRSLSKSSSKLCKEVEPSNNLNPPAAEKINPGARTHKPNNLERKFLVWTGKYKSLAEIPNHVSNDEMERCRNRIRIRVANIMMVFTCIGCIVMVISGKRAAERGESVSKMNLDWHKKYNEQQQEREVK